jgi:hypothetical protein
MSTDEQTALVLSRLAGAGYQPLQQPIIIGGIPFQFAATLVKDSSLDLIALADSRRETDEMELRAKVQGLGRALDLLQSRRTLTLIILGPRPSTTLTSELSRVARVLLIEAPAGAGTQAELDDSLAVLMPLAPTTAPDEPVESWASARETLRSRYPGKDTAALFAAAPRGSRRVRDTLKDALSAPFKKDPA